MPIIPSGSTIRAEAVFTARSTSAILKGDSCYYLFAHGLGMKGNINVELVKDVPDFNNTFTLPDRVKSVKWLDNGQDLLFTQEGDRVTVTTTPQLYGHQLVVKIAKIEVEA